MGRTAVSCDRLRAGDRTGGRCVRWGLGGTGGGAVRSAFFAVGFGATAGFLTKPGSALRTLEAKSSASLSGTAREKGGRKEEMRRVRA